MVSYPLDNEYIDHTSSLISIVKLRSGKLPFRQ